jgi:hypothetical protein
MPFEKMGGVNSERLIDREFQPADKQKPADAGIVPGDDGVGQELAERAQAKAPKRDKEEPGEQRRRAAGQ